MLLYVSKLPSKGRVTDRRQTSDPPARRLTWSCFHQYVRLQVPKGLNGLPPTFRFTKTSIVFFGPGPAVAASAKRSRKKLSPVAPPEQIVALMRLFAAESLNHNLAVPLT